MTMIVKEVTPEAFRVCKDCGCGCPAVFETARGTYVIIGKKTDAAAFGVSVGADETAVMIEKAMITGI
jgi:hypothetical protein